MYLYYLNKLFIGHRIDLNYQIKKLLYKLNSNLLIRYDSIVVK